MQLPKDASGGCAHQGCVQALKGTFLLWNALARVNFANYPDPLKLKADEVSVW